MAAAWKSNLPELERRLADAQRGGLIGAAQVGLNAIRRALRGGYTSGEYVTGTSANSFTRTEPAQENGVWSVRIGTPLLYPLFWELGWHDRAGGFHRVEKIRPAIEDARGEMVAAYSRIVMRLMGVAV